MEKERKLRVKFCLACKSFRIKYVHGLSNLFGIIPKQKCLDCGLETEAFPILEITEKELNKKVNKMKKKKVKKTKKSTKKVRKGSARSIPKKLNKGAKKK